MSVVKLLLIRHAQSIGNQQQRMQGWVDDDLSVQGCQQANRLAQRLYAEGWHPTHVYSSPLKRAAQTTERLLTSGLAESPMPGGWARSPNPPSQPLRSVQVTYAEELQEFQNGILRGLTWHEAQAIYPELCAALESAVEWLPIPEAESLQELRDRAQRFIQTLLSVHASGNDRIWVVTHSLILQHLIAALLGCDRSWGIQIPNTALFEFWWVPSLWQTRDHNRFNTELWQIRRFNDCRHLADG